MSDEVEQLRDELSSARRALKAYLTLIEDLRSDVGALDSEGTREAILRLVHERDSLAAMAAVLGEEVARQRKES